MAQLRTFSGEIFYLPNIMINFFVDIRNVEGSLGLFFKAQVE